MLEDNSLDLAEIGAELEAEVAATIPPIDKAKSEAAANPESAFDPSAGVVDSTDSNADKSLSFAIVTGADCTFSWRRRSWASRSASKRMRSSFLSRELRSTLAFSSPRAFSRSTCCCIASYSRRFLSASSASNRRSSASFSNRDASFSNLLRSVSSSNVLAGSSSIFKLFSLFVVSRSVGKRSSVLTLFNSILLTVIESNANGLKRSSEPLTSPRMIIPPSNIISMSSSHGAFRFIPASSSA
mmetsp:Transcript_21758/g.62395  ORF Transcript_21758/g.62395 Transcript_21758/m.62395 type:complete len:242 (-) Transcript_21758:1119-1844(-)